MDRQASQVSFKFGVDRDAHPPKSYPGARRDDVSESVGSISA
jgi:hypothetical protein